MENNQTNNTSEKSAVALREEKILAFWKEHDIFNKTIEKPAIEGSYVFYDGPPFGTGTPHYGHLLAGTIKDVFPRYETMRGKRVYRKWGWDCHGLPIENIIEKELGLNTKKDIEKYGIEAFNTAAKNSVLRFAHEWERMVPRMGRWVDMQDDYKTMDATYTESIWWAFHTLYEKGLIYEGYKAMQLCPRCETTLSNFEVNQGYKDITDISVYVAFPLVDEPDTSVIAWTTTPWTLPGNVALAINPELTYVKIVIADKKYILAKDRLSVIKQAYSILEEGVALVGRGYVPPFTYYSADMTLANHEHGWKIYPASFVTLDTGTGVVHIAPAFGEDDMNLGKVNNLPFVQHVKTDGTFKPEVADFAGLSVKPKDDHQKADIEIIKYLAGKGSLFDKEKIIHLYPHCWRCDTPLLNYASSSWFVGATKIQDKIIEANQSVSWVPGHVRDGRFGKWLENMRDWAISRSRYWGAPLPVWKCTACEKIHVGKSVEDIRSKTKHSGNTYILMRHGEADQNIKLGISCHVDAPDHLTARGVQQVELAGQSLAHKKIDMIIHSDFVRTTETVATLKQTLNIADEYIIADERLREFNVGTYHGKTWEVFHNEYPKVAETFGMQIPEGESYADVKKRMAEVLYELEEKYQNKTILIVSHGTPLWMMTAVASGYTPVQSVEMVNKTFTPFVNAEIRELDFRPLSHDAEYVLDLHRPYIDRIVLTCECGADMHRITDVFDCWFESGSMPFAQFHYPFTHQQLFYNNFPADFIAEGIDQTRGWFYSLLVLGVGLFDKSPYKQVVVNGIVLATDGQKMSKKLKNYTDPQIAIDMFGADAIRFYLVSSPASHGEDANFSDKDLGEVLRKNIMRLDNVFAFYEMYRGSMKVVHSAFSPHVLDQWIVARLNETIRDVNIGMKAYELDRATRPIESFIDDLSTWYLRRSRERLKGDDQEDMMHAQSVLEFVFEEFIKIIAPFMPFLAEDLYQKLVREHDISAVESVHLCAWPSERGVDEEVIRAMAETRRIVTLGLEARQKAGLKVRQPLASIVLKKYILSDAYTELIKDELNVKAVRMDPTQEAELMLDTNITEELKQEGLYREFVRAVQDLRKKMDLTPQDRITITVSLEVQNLLGIHEQEFRKIVQADSVIYTTLEHGEVIDIEGIQYRIEIK